jgi:hypothetical protein
MAFLALVDAPLSSESMKFPVFSLLAGNLGSQETGSLETASSSAESSTNPSVGNLAASARCYSSAAECKPD